jgi:hypothetical protein
MLYQPFDLKSVVTWNEDKANASLKLETIIFFRHKVASACRRVNSWRQHCSYIAGYIKWFPCSGFQEYWKTCSTKLPALMLNPFNWLTDGRVIKRALVLGTAALWDFVDWVCVHETSTYAATASGYCSTLRLSGLSLRTRNFNLCSHSFWVLQHTEALWTEFAHTKLQLMQPQLLGSAGSVAIFKAVSLIWVSAHMPSFPSHLLIRCVLSCSHICYQIVHIHVLNTRIESQRNVHSFIKSWATKNWCCISKKYRKLTNSQWYVI